MNLVKDTLTSFLKKIKKEKIVASLKAREVSIYLIGIITLPSLLFSVQNFSNSISSYLLMFFLLFINKTIAGPLYRFLEKDKTAYIYYTLEMLMIGLSVSLLTNYNVKLFHPLTDVFFLSIILSCFYMNRGLIVYTTFLAILIKTTLYFYFMKVDYFMNVIRSTSNPLFYFTDIFYRDIVFGLFGFICYKLVQVFKSTENVYHKYEMRILFQELINRIGFVNKKIKIKNMEFESVVKQSDYIGGGDFVSLIEKDGTVYGMIGDILSHGSGVMPGAQLAMVSFYNIISCVESKSLTPSLIISGINNALHNLPELNGGRAYAIVFKISGNSIHYSGFIYRNCFKINGKAQPLTSAFILGEKETYPVGVNKVKIKSGDVIEMTTDGWINKDSGDDMAMLRISVL